MEWQTKNKLIKLYHIQRVISNYTAENILECELRELLNFIMEETLELQDLIKED